LPEKKYAAQRLLVPKRQTPALPKARKRTNEKAARQRDGLFFQGRIVPTEVKTVKTFWRNLMGGKSGVSRNFWEINIFIFNYLDKRLT
jgi:hypothetical protein